MFKTISLNPKTRHRTLSRSTFETYAGIALAILQGVVPVSWWWFKIILFVALWAMAVDIIFNSEWMAKFVLARKALYAILVAIVIGAFGYQPVLSGYYGDELKFRHSDYVQLLNNAISGTQNKKDAANEIIQQFALLSFATTVFENETGRTDFRQRIATQNYIIGLLRLVIDTVDIQAFRRGDSLFIRVADNDYRVTYPASQRTMPHLEIYNVPEGSQAKVSGESNFGFTVIFEPPTIKVEHFGYRASSEL